MRSLEYFEAHPGFTHAEFLAAHTAKGRSPSTSNNLLAKHLAARRLIRVRRGLYAAGIGSAQMSIVSVQIVLVSWPTALRLRPWFLFPL
jgi:hypothetical protein